MVSKRLDEVLQQFKEVFGEELETACTLSVPLKLKENSQNKFVPTRPVLFTFKNVVAQAIQSLE